MLTRWSISNFKSIREPVTIELAPLTIFSGINSAGKSTILQSILMVSQSFMSAATLDSIVLNGHFLQLGHFEDILHVGNEREPIDISIEYLPGERGNLAFSIEARLVLRSAIHSVAKENRRLRPHIQYSKLRFARKEKNSKVHTLEVRAIPEADMKISLHHLRPDLKKQIKTGLYDFGIDAPKSEEFVRNPLLERVERVSMTTLIPWRLLIGRNIELSKLVQDVEWLTSTMAKIEATGDIPLLGPELPPFSSRLHEVVRCMKFNDRGRIVAENWGRGGRDRNDLTPLYNELTSRNRPPLAPHDVLTFLRQGDYTPQVIGAFSRLLVAALSEFLRNQPNFTRTDRQQIDLEAQLFPPEYAEALDQINEVMGGKIYYLGPLRDDPRVIYAIPPRSDRLGVGLKGEYTAAMLNQYCNEPVKYPLPPNSDFTGEFTYSEAPLIKAVSAWLQRMGLVDEVDTQETARVGYQITVGETNLSKKLDLTSVGVGVSQILPTLVLALLVPNDTTLIYEQPELHLHPKVQSVLADFFLGIALMGKQCLIETHSEHFIHRLRRRILESEQEIIRPNLRIYFVEKENGASQFREVKPNSFGAILEWPKGFFDETENEANLILKKQIEKRKRLRAQQKEQKEVN